MLPFIQQHPYLTDVIVAIQVDDPQLRSVLYLHIIPDQMNITFTPLDANGTVIDQGVVVDWSMVMPEATWEVKTLNSTTQALPACQSMTGCDGFSVPIATLVRLSPAHGYRIAIFYEVELPASSIVICPGSKQHCYDRHT